MSTQPTLKRSKQRDAIIHFLQGRKDHPTADVVYHELRTIMPNISLGTVYRNLSLLSDRGEILRLSCDNKCDHFDADTTPHYHFICKCCGCVKDLDLPYLADINEQAATELDVQIEQHTLFFEGQCKDCYSV